MTMTRVHLERLEPRRERQPARTACGLSIIGMTQRDWLVLTDPTYVDCPDCREYAASKFARIAEDSARAGLTDEVADLRRKARDFARPWQPQ